MLIDRRWPRRAVEICLAALLPADCLLCGDPLPWRQEGSVCRPCWSLVPWAAGMRPGAGALRAVLWGSDYEGRLRDLIHACKFERLDFLGRPLGERLAERVAPLFDGALSRPDLVVPVPLHRWRRLRRGFNQARLLAAPLAGRLEIPLARRALIRRDAGRRQLGLSRRQRLAALDACYAAPSGGRGARLAGLRVLLVDDVMTTGATLEACARVLLRAGARSVIGCVLARTPECGGRGARRSRDGPIPPGLSS